MKLIIERLNKDAKSSFVLQKDIYAHYPTPWHYHPEFELVLVLKSSGDKIIGDHMSSFTDGDLVFMGPNLPHVYRNSKVYYEENSDLTAEAIVIHFNLDFLGNGFFSIPEMETVARFLEESVMGFSISGNTRQVVAQKMFVNFLNGVRIGYACKLLSGEEHNISEICYLSGFNNLSNFNRRFMRIKPLT